MLCKVYGNINKNSLLNMANNVKERFNNANFRSKTSGRIQQIKSVEVIEHGTTVYF